MAPRFLTDFELMVMLAAVGILLNVSEQGKETSKPGDRETRG